MTERLLYGNFIGTFSSVMMRAETVERVGLLDERLPCWQNWEYYLRLAREYEFVAVPEPLVIRPNASTGQVSRGFAAKRDVAYPLLREAIEPIAALRGALVGRRAIASLDFELGYAALANGKQSEARRYLFRAVARYPFRPGFYPYLLAALVGESAYSTLRRYKRQAVDRLSRDG